MFTKVGAVFLSRPLCSCLFETRSAIFSKRLCNEKMITCRVCRRPEMWRDGVELVDIRLYRKKEAAGFSITGALRTSEI